ncbi:metabotropic glutamate receptor-like [Teleopsis dalmanni]|uniref:metabotropic glutamate receptor-like n=1 Tax=Teleopsis dalmanni TaxID=139649 RepID=UPI0018CDDA1F|nr:metabotropic glutamate receptor-like [Teleopsis dalmanni]
MVWMIVEPPGTRFYYPDRNEVILKCKIQDMSFLFSQLYNMILITICTIYAIKTRKIPENFNESKFIGFTMYTTCIIWLAFVPIYFGTGNSYEIQITTLCISISLSASVALICLYSPKVYILVFHPDKNIRKLTMNSTVYRRSGAAHTHSAAGVIGGSTYKCDKMPSQSQYNVTGTDVQDASSVIERKFSDNGSVHDQSSIAEISEMNTTIKQQEHFENSKILTQITHNAETAFNFNGRSSTEMILTAESVKEQANTSAKCECPTLY